MPKNPNRNYKKETAYENRPEQVARRVERNKDRKAAEKKGLVHKGDNKEVDHIGKNRKGDLSKRKTRVISKIANRKIQPKRGG